uniref:Uncharacterized protein n=2 Tax=Clastoptera arizonana TaxID=38151 RepID=A0A1B6DGF4_9HEMI
MSTRYDTLEERIIGLEDKLVNIQEQVELLPELLTRCLNQQQQQQQPATQPQQTQCTLTADRSNDRRNFLHPESAAAISNTPSTQCTSPLLSDSRSVPPTSSSTPYHWPTSPILPPISSRTPHLVPEPLHPNS